MDEAYSVVLSMCHSKDEMHTLRPFRPSHGEHNESSAILSFNGYHGTYRHAVAKIERV